MINVFIVINYMKIENMVRHLKYKVVDTSNRINHYSYNKQNAMYWIKHFGNKEDIYSIEKLILGDKNE